MLFKHRTYLKIIGKQLTSIREHLIFMDKINAPDKIAMVKKYSALDRIGFMHIRNVKIMEDGSFEERAHLSSCGSLDMAKIVSALVECGFDGYVRPDHGRMRWGEVGKPGYGLFDRALGAAYINGLFEAYEKG